MAVIELYGSFSHASCKQMCAMAISAIANRMTRDDVNNLPKEQIELLRSVIEKLEPSKPKR
jgi:hypothetical protein